jgi:hypothetical protein
LIELLQISLDIAETDYLNNVEDINEESEEDRSKIKNKRTCYSSGTILLTNCSESNKYIEGKKHQMNKDS